VQHDLMRAFAAAGGASEPQPIFFEYCTTLIGSESTQAQAERYYRLALRLLPDSAEALYALALLRRRAGDAREAIALFEAATRARQHPNALPHAQVAGNSWRNLAEIHRDQGDDRLAEAAFRKALELIGNHGVYHHEIAEWLRRRGRLGEAALQYELTMPYSHLYASEFSEPNFPPGDRLPLDTHGRPFDPLKPTILEEGNQNSSLIYWWHLYFLIPSGAPFDPMALIKMRPDMRHTAITASELMNRDTYRLERPKT
jgi:tetratricopeptide (TPR) repeat protein